MKTHHKRKLSLLLSILLLITLLSGCAPDNTKLRESVTYEGNVTLRVVIDDESTALLGNTYEKIINEFEEEYENVTVEIATVSAYTKEYGGRNALREAIQSGEGPDIFLLETDIYSSSAFDQLLFPDVNQAMRDGLFADLSMYYDLDEELDRGGLLKNVMDAGMVSSSRFTLPLSYDYPVMFVNVRKAQEVGLEESDFENGIIPLMDALAELGDPQVASCADFCEGRYFFNFFPELLDYDTGEILVTREELVTFLNSYMTYREAKGTVETPKRNPTYETYTKHLSWLQLDQCMRAGWSLSDVLLETQFAKHNGAEMKIYPMTGADGKIVAEVRQFGAVNAGCDNVGLAYMFLREFLTEENQWFQNTGTRVSFKEYAVSQDRLEFHGYPVRSKGFVEPFFSGPVAIHYELPRIGRDDKDEARIIFLEANGTEVKESDIPILKETIDVARFPAGALEWEFSMNVIEKFERGGWTADTVDVEAMADDFLEELQIYLAE